MSSKMSSFVKPDFKVHFFKGQDSRYLSLGSQQQVKDILTPNLFGNSMLIYNKNEAVTKIQDWKQKLPEIQPYYAIKSNPIYPLLQDLYSQGANFDCASQNEIKSVLAMGVSPSQIVFSNPVKNEEDLVYAEKKKVRYTTADSLDELIKISKFAPKMRILWRISIKEDASKGMTCFSGKFGDDIVTHEEIANRFEQIKAMGITIDGIHFHCGSSKHGSIYFTKAVENARDCMHIGRMLGHRMEVLDIGGGFPAGKLADNIDQVLEPITKDPLGYQVIAEPGRHFSQTSCLLATRIIGKKFKNDIPCFHVNDSLYHSFNCVLMDNVNYSGDQAQYYGSSDAVSKELGKTKLFGMTCDGIDVICDDFRMPLDAQLGDWMVFGGMGSYTFGPKSQFNGMITTDKISQFEGSFWEERPSEGAFIENVVE